MAKMNEMTVSRVFEKRATDKSNWSGRVGHVDLHVSAKGGELVMELGGKAIPESMMQYLLTFSLQSLQDAYAGASSLEEAIGMFTKKLEAVQEGTLGSRGGAGASEETICQRLVAKAAYLASAKVSDADKEKAKKLADGEADAMWDGIFAKNAAKLAEAVTKKMAERAEARAKRAAEKAAAAKMADGLDF